MAEFFEGRIDKNLKSEQCGVYATQKSNEFMMERSNCYEYEFTNITYIEL